MIPKKQFGNTGHESTRTLFGGAALWDVSQDEANKILDLILKYGINHIDTAASYGDSELRIGPWMREHRKDFFWPQRQVYGHTRMPKKNFITPLIACVSIQLICYKCMY